MKNPPIDSWLFSVAPTARAILRQYHQGTAQLCPGASDARCCRFEPAMGDTDSFKGLPCSTVKWHEEDSEYHVLKIVTVIHAINRFIKYLEIDYAVSEAIILGKMIRDYEILFYSPESIDRIDTDISDNEAGNRRWLYGNDLLRVTAVDRLRLKGLSVSAAWDAAAVELGCSRSTIRRAWEKLF